MFSGVGLSAETQCPTGSAWGVLENTHKGQGLGSALLVKPTVALPFCVRCLCTSCVTGKKHCIKKREGKIQPRNRGLSLIRHLPLTPLLEQKTGYPFPAFFPAPWGLLPSINRHHSLTQTPTLCSPFFKSCLLPFWNGIKPFPPWQLSPTLKSVNTGRRR